MFDLLLKKISLINLKYEKLQEINESDFNVFSILRKENDEVALHSRFIGELLNPKGTHNQASTFLHLFISSLNNKIQLDNANFSLSIERSFGNFGRIDLVLTSENDVIVIENKIHAIDQSKQLERYNDAVTEYFGSKDKHLVYLTLFGDPPSEASLGYLKNNDIICISYADFIREWLTQCAREAYDYPSLRETIVQYKKLIEKLTGQTINERQKMELKTLILTEGNFESALAIEQVMKDVKADLQKTVWKELQTSLKKEGFDFEFVNHKFESASLDVCNDFYKTTNRAYYYGLQHQILSFDDYGVHLYMEVEDRFYYGFVVSKNGVLGEFRDELLDKQPDLKSKIDLLISTDEDCEWWLAWKYSEDKINFRNYEEGNSSKLSNSAYRSKWVNDVKDDVVKLIKQFNELFSKS
ncbi:PD-(D/E)XK nuclease family protein [Vibrio vulnificus]|nr:PD-(D/E)XK nuclease family protein [Vibrio vulnificus]